MTTSTPTPEQAADQLVDETNDAFNQLSQQLVEVDGLYLDGEYDRPAIKRRIQQAKLIIGQQIYLMGRDLLVLKEHCQHGEFLTDLKEMEISHGTAQRYMSIAVRYNSPKLQQLANTLTGKKGVFSKLLDLATESDEDLESLVMGGTVAGLQLDDIDRMSARELRAVLRKTQETATADKDANDHLLADKNQHADELAKKLAKAEGVPVYENWPQQATQHNADLQAYGQDARTLVTRVNDIILAGLLDSESTMPQSARKDMALQALAQVNQLADLVAQMQNNVHDIHSQFINQPTYMLADPLLVADLDEDA